MAGSPRETGVRCHTTGSLNTFLCLLSLKGKQLHFEPATCCSVSPPWRGEYGHRAPQLLSLPTGPVPRAGAQHGPGTSQGPRQLQPRGSPRQRLCGASPPPSPCPPQPGCRGAVVVAGRHVQEERGHLAPPATLSASGTKRKGYGQLCNKNHSYFCHEVTFFFAIFDFWLAQDCLLQGHHVRSQACSLTSPAST